MFLDYLRRFALLHCFTCVCARVCMCRRHSLHVEELAGGSELLQLGEGQLDLSSGLPQGCGFLACSGGQGLNEPQWER